MWTSNVIAFALLYWELDGGGAAPGLTAARPPGSRVPAAAQPGLGARVAAPVRRLPLPRVHQRDRVQPDRRDAARAWAKLAMMVSP